MTFWGLAGTGGKRSMITLRGGGGTRLPAMTIRFGWTLGGGGGGAGAAPVGDRLLLQIGQLLIGHAQGQERNGTVAADGEAGGRARVAGRDEHFADAGRLRELPGQRVFAAAVADDEDFHAQILSA